MEQGYTIGQLADRADVPVTTVRYYERIGLLPPVGRTASNYRYYSDASLRRLRFIKAAQATGFSLDDTRDLLDLAEQSRSPCGEVQQLTEHRLAELQQHITELKNLEQSLVDSLERCRSSQPQRCEVIEHLTAHDQR